MGLFLFWNLVKARSENLTGREVFSISFETLPESRQNQAVSRAGGLDFIGIQSVYAITFCRERLSRMQRKERGK
jgi:hypothetical protein